jgi:hypothetical protein
MATINEIWQSDQMSGSSRYGSIPGKGEGIGLPRSLDFHPPFFALRNARFRGNGRSAQNSVPVQARFHLSPPCPGPVSPRARYEQVVEVFPQTPMFLQINQDGARFTVTV